MAVEAARLEHAFERAPALVDRLAAEAPFPSANAVIARARSLLEAMTERDRIAVLDAHPRVGADPRILSADSAREQGGDSEPAVLERLADLNALYERTFGFRFVVFVAGRPKSEIVPVLERRLRRTREQELATGTEEFLAIALDRLER
ncbi:MAG: 2-oxo-4-hydroxy-4-carboxy-5-ureidoimidazoline decarboxylase [Chloroflexi bacterium]|nr:2-oxo-4-hydroxy-4-carboxy-5-ureidoimidazoline decarboxylase [Chloroflexota bacterium]